MPTLNYLDFDESEDTDGFGTFDAMASVPASRLPALQAELAAVLAWAHAHFGPPGPEQDWDMELHGTREVATPLQVVFRPDDAQLAIESEGRGGEPRTTLALTLSGSAAFCQALREQWRPG